MNVSEIMTTDPIFVEATVSVREVLDILTSQNIRHLPVIDEGELSGLISDRDIRTYLLPEFVQFDSYDAQDRLDAPISSIMRGDVISVEPETDVGDVVRMMIDQKVGAIPVVEFATGELVGILSYIDVLRAAEPFFGVE